MQEVFEKIIEQLKSEVKRWEDSGTEYEDKCEIAVGRGLRNAIEIVKQEAEQYNNGWIPCSERLPDDRKEKLVYLSSDRITVAIYNEHRLPHSGCSIGWGYRVPDGYIDFEKETVIAWQPLPQPYQPKGE